jgi:hypothetical protein
MHEAQNVNIDIQEGRVGDCASWELPAWGHPISLFIFPLFYCVEGHLFPIGTAFNIAHAFSIALTAHHNILEGVKHHRFPHLPIREGVKQYSLDDVSYYLFHQWVDTTTASLRYSFVPLEGYKGAPPTDVGIYRPKFAVGVPSISVPLSFAVLPNGERIRSVGYTNFCYPENGIPVEGIRDGTFDLHKDYSHQIQVVEGHVRQTFAREFASSYIAGPCFSVSNEIPHGLSGGPAIDAQGVVRGICSASATSFFDEPTSIISLLYPLLFQEFTVGADIGPMRMNSTQTFIELVARGEIRTDGSEGLVHFREEDGSFIIGPIVPTEIAPFVHESFRHLNENIPSPRETEPVKVVRKRLRRVDRES